MGRDGLKEGEEMGGEKEKRPKEGSEDMKAGIGRDVKREEEVRDEELREVWRKEGRERDEGR
jgi:hypothetical protein